MHFSVAMVSEQRVIFSYVYRHAKVHIMYFHTKLCVSFSFLDMPELTLYTTFFLRCHSCAHIMFFFPSFLWLSELTWCNTFHHKMECTISSLWRGGKGAEQRCKGRTMSERKEKILSTGLAIPFLTQFPRCVRWRSASSEVCDWGREAQSRDTGTGDGNLDTAWGRVVKGKRKKCSPKPASAAFGYVLQSESGSVHAFYTNNDGEINNCSSLHLFVELYYVSARLCMSCDLGKSELMPLSIIANLLAWNCLALKNTDLTEIDMISVKSVLLECLALKKIGIRVCCCCLPFWPCVHFLFSGHEPRGLAIWVCRCELCCCCGRSPAQAPNVREHWPTEDHSLWWQCCYTQGYIKKKHWCPSMCTFHSFCAS